MGNSNGPSTGEFGDDGSANPTSQSPVEDEVSPEDLREASSLVYDRLQDELRKGTLDRELLDELGYNEKDVARFTEQLQERLNQGDALTPAESARARQFDAILEQIGREASATERRGGDKLKKDAGGFNAPRREAPLDYRQLERIYKQRLLRGDR